jgi:hypothetical protein
MFSGTLKGLANFGLLNLNFINDVLTKLKTTSAPRPVALANTSIFSMNKKAVERAMTTNIAQKGVFLFSWTKAKNFGKEPWEAIPYITLLPLIKVC